MSGGAAMISHDSAAALLQVSPDDLTRLVGAGLVRRAAPGKYSPAQIIRDYIGHLQKEPERRERAPTQVEIAAHLDMSERNLRDVLEQLGANHKQTSLAEIRVGYIRRLREQAAGRLGDGDMDLVQERAALAKAQRIGQEIKNAVAQAEYAPVGLLADVLAAASAAVVDRFDALPGVLRKACPDLPAEARDAIDKTIASARNEWIRSTVKLAVARLDELVESDEAPDMFEGAPEDTSAP